MKMRAIFEGQWLHLVCLLALLGAVFLAMKLPGATQGELFGLGTPFWLWLGVAIAVVHQVYVWLIWRLELHNKAISPMFGGRGFRAYTVGFAILGIARIIAVFFIAYANRDTFVLPVELARVLAIIMALPAIYLFYSVRRYFTFDRAFGDDHFDPAARERPFETRGIFKYTSNGMYVYGFFLLWAAALWFNSTAGLIVALFNHAYVWVHYFATERPDFRHIYSDQA